MFLFVNHLIIKTEKIEKGTFCPNSKQNQMIIIYSINVQAVCYYRYCFLDVAEKKPGSVHDSRIFLNSSINKKLRNLETPKCEKTLVEGYEAIPTHLIGDLAYPLLVPELP